MQNWNGCSSLTESTHDKPYEITLVDSRDNKQYYVAKLADQNCWMVENLDLDINKDTTYTVADTDLAYAFDEDKKNSQDSNGNYQWIPDKSTYTTEITTWDTTRNNGTTSQSSNGDTIQQSYDIGDYCWNKLISNTDGSGATWFNQHTIACQKHQAVTGSDPHYHLGNYYNYGAAVAQNDTSSKKNGGDHYNTSICPAGWQLPPKDGNKSYQNLYNQAKAKDYELKAGIDGNIQDAPYWLFYGGYWRGVSIAVGYDGVYWSNAVSSVTPSYVLDFFGNGTLRPQNPGGYRLDGFSVRCVSRN